MKFCFISLLLHLVIILSIFAFSNKQEDIDFIEINSVESLEISFGFNRITSNYDSNSLREENEKNLKVIDKEEIKIQEKTDINIDAEESLVKVEEFEEKVVEETLEELDEIEIVEYIEEIIEEIIEEEQEVEETIIEKIQKIDEQQEEEILEEVQEERLQEIEEVQKVQELREKIDIIKEKKDIVNKSKEEDIYQKNYKEIRELQERTILKKEEVVKSNLDILVENNNIIKDATLGYIVKNQDIEGIHYELISTPEPRYPSMARRARIRHDVIIKVRFLVNKDGKVEDIRFYDDVTEYGFRQEVIRALNNWQLSPVMIGDEVVNMYFYKVFRFNIK